MCSFHGSNLKAFVTILVSKSLKELKDLKKKYLYISANFECRTMTLMVNSKNSFTKWSIRVVSFTHGLSFYVTVVNVCLFLKKMKPYRIVKFTFLCLPTPCFSRGAYYQWSDTCPSTCFLQVYKYVYMYVCMYATRVLIFYKK